MLGLPAHVDLLSLCAWGGHPNLWRRLELPSGQLRTVLDTDTCNEVDDQFVLVQALLSPDRLAVETYSA